MWDVPFLTEWLTLAGCDSENNPYPWGNTPPTKTQANINFGDGSRLKLHPVGAFPKGVSPHGIMDCCGNVHEIVRIDEAKEFPSGYRLAGGCYQTASARTSCHLVRRFTQKNKEDRRNVGLRLVLVKKDILDKRHSSMESFRRSKHPAAISLFD